KVETEACNHASCWIAIHALQVRCQQFPKFDGTFHVFSRRIFSSPFRGHPLKQNNEKHPRTAGRIKAAFVQQRVPTFGRDVHNHLSEPRWCIICADFSAHTFGLSLVLWRFDFLFARSNELFVNCADEFNRYESEVKEIKIQHWLLVNEIVPIQQLDQDIHMSRPKSRLFFSEAAAEHAAVEILVEQSKQFEERDNGVTLAGDSLQDVVKLVGYRSPNRF